MLEKIKWGISIGWFIKKEIINDEFYKWILKGVFISLYIERWYIYFIELVIV